MLQRATKGDTVHVHYTGRLKDGTVFDSSRTSHAPQGEASTSAPGVSGKPMEFVIGDGRVIPGFDSAVSGMHVGDKKTIEIQPQDAYGEHAEELVKVVPRQQLNLSFDVQKGMVLRLQTEAGRDIPITVTDVSDETITLDANHPLAGQILFFDIELMAISSGQA